jgi:hypothetical protein
MTAPPSPRAEGPATQSEARAAAATRSPSASPCLDRRHRTRRVPRARPGRRGHPPRNHLRRPLRPCRRLGLGDDVGPLGRHRPHHLRPSHLERAVLTALRRVRIQRRDHGPRRRRQDLPGHRLRASHRAPPVQRPLRTLRPDAQTAPRLRPRQQRRGRDAPAAPASTCSSWTTSHCNRSTRWTPPTSTN